MKKIEKEELIKRIVVTWEAEDGTEFTTESQCKDYEESAKCVINSLYKSYIIGQTDEWELLKGDSDHKIDILSVTTAAVPIILKQIAYTCNSKEIDAETINTVRDSVGDILFLCWNYDGDWCWVLGSKTSLIERINKVVNQYVKETNTEGENN